nr:hypothetical protein [uncultured Desulfobacter sp.]
MESLGNFLAYGAIGLGLALAVLAYLLLRKEQGVAKPRTEIIKAIYVFMGFALILSLGGFVGELLKSDAASIVQVRAQLDEKTKKLEEMEEKYRLVDQKLSSSRMLMQSLMDLKGGKIARLKQLDPDRIEYAALVREIQNDLEQIDRSLNEALRK